MATDEGKIPEGGQEAPKEPAAPRGAKPKQKPPKKGGGFPTWAIWVIVIVIIAVIAGIAVGVVMAMSGGGENQAPVITSLTADPDSIAPGEGSTITCVADDADDDTLTYTWTANGGTISGTGDTITWIAPPLAKGYVVEVAVSDGNGGADEDSVAIVVAAAPTPTPTSPPTPTPTSTSVPTPTATATVAPTPSQGSIDIKSSPTGAAVYIDGVDTGSITPYVATHISEGDHTVLLKLYHYENKAGVVSVSAGGTEYINWAMDWSPTQSVTIQPDGTDGKDAYVYEASPAMTTGTAERVYVSGDAAGQQLRSYLQFDLGTIPATAVVLNAQFGLYYHTQSTLPAISGPAGVYRVTSSWDEATVTWDTQPSALATPVDTVTIPASHTDSFLYWDIKTLAQKWVDGSVTNNGILLMDTDESTFEGWKYFYSSDFTTANERPKLVIQYYDPAP